MEILAQIMEVVIIPLLGILTAYVVKVVNAKLDDAAASRKNEIEKKNCFFDGLQFACGICSCGSNGI